MRTNDRRVDLQLLKVEISKFGTIFAHRPLFEKPLKRWWTLFQLPKRSGRSLHPAPVFAIQNTAFMKLPLLWARAPRSPGSPGLPGIRCSMRAKSASLMACRVRDIDFSAKSTKLHHYDCQQGLVPQPISG